MLGPGRSSFLWRFGRRRRPASLSSCGMDRAVQERVQGSGFRIQGSGFEVVSGGHRLRSAGHSSGDHSLNQ